MSEMKVGFIGLGVMGRPMAKNLIKAGYELIVYDVNQAATAELKEFGAEVSEDLRGIAENCPVIITMLPNGPHVKSVMFDEGGLYYYAKPGTMFLDMSSIAPTDTVAIGARLKEKGYRMVDAPVSGAYSGAVEGTLAIMVGGSEEDIADVMPLLNVMGGKITRIGDLGSGNICKLCNNIIIAAELAAVSESMMLAKKSGCDINKVFEAISTGFAGSAVLNSQVPKILEHEFKAGFRIALHLKDLRNAEAAAQQAGAPVPLTEFTIKIMEDLTADGLDGLDNSGVAKYYEKLAGVSYIDA